MTEALGTPQPITGLTLDQVLPLLFKSEFSQKLARQRFEESTEHFDFHMEAYQARTEVAGERHGYLDKSESSELKDFLKRNRPPTLFFEPQKIAVLLTPDSDIIVDHEKSSTFEQWQFTLNPTRFKVSSDWTSPDRKQTLTLVQGKAPRREDYPEEYLVIDFPARYDGSTITFYPQIKMTYGDTIPRVKIEQAMIKLLGLKEHSVPQQLEFQALKKQRSMTTRDSLGRVTDQKVWDIYPVEISLKKSS